MSSQIVSSGQGRWAEAVCSLETPDAPELWTSDRRPGGLLGRELARMCARCPARRRCAREAVLTEGQAGTYAGVYLPQNRVGGAAQRAAALDELRVIAGLPSAGTDFDRLGATA